MDEKVRQFEFADTPPEIMEIYLDYINGIEKETDFYEKVQLLKLTTKIKDEDLSEVKKLKKIRQKKLKIF